MNKETNTIHQETLVNANVTFNVNVSVNANPCANVTVNANPNADQCYC
jgi:hypothetical protein